jgi:hypothetical protein
MNDATPETRAEEWVEARFPVHKRPKYGDGDFTEADVVEAFAAGYAAAKGVAPGPLETLMDIAVFAEPGGKIDKLARAAIAKATAA